MWESLPRQNPETLPSAVFSSLGWAQPLSRGRVLARLPVRTQPFRPRQSLRITTYQAVTREKPESLPDLFEDRSTESVPSRPQMFSQARLRLSRWVNLLRFLARRKTSPAWMLPRLPIRDEGGGEQRPGVYYRIVGTIGEPANESKSDVSENSASPKGAPEVYVRRFSTEKDASESMSFEPRGSSDTDPFSASMSVGSATRSEGREVEPSFSLASEPAGATESSPRRIETRCRANRNCPTAQRVHQVYLWRNEEPRPGERHSGGRWAGRSEDGQRESCNSHARDAVSADIGAQQAMPQPRQSAGYPHVPTPTPIAPPPIPQRPQIGTAPPKAAAVPWTLILILNGLFVLAVLLVLYFGLKH